MTHYFYAIEDKFETLTWNKNRQGIVRAYYVWQVLQLNYFCIAP